MCVHMYIKMHIQQYLEAAHVENEAPVAACPVREREGEVLLDVERGAREEQRRQWRDSTRKLVAGV